MFLKVADTSRKIQRKLHRQKEKERYTGIKPDDLSLVSELCDSTKPSRRFD